MIKVTFWQVELVDEKIIGSFTTVGVTCWCIKGTCIPNYNLIGQELPKLSHIFTFGWVGWLGRSVRMHFSESVIIKVASPKVLPRKRLMQELKPFLRYPIFTIFQENIYKTEIWLVGPPVKTSCELFSYLVSPYQVLYSSNQKCWSYSILKILL